MNILQIVPRLDLGGVERGVVDFARYLTENGHKSLVISAGGRLVESITNSGSIHYTLPVHKKSIFSILFCIRQVKKIILNEKIDIVHCRSRVPDWIGFFAALKSPAQFVVTCHGYYSTHFFSKIVALAKLVISPSFTVARHLTENLGVSKSKISIIPRGLNLDEFNFRPFHLKNFKEITICFVGRLSPIKGIEYLIEATNRLTRHFPNLTCLIIGQASKKHRDYGLLLKRKVVKLGLAGRVKFLGRANTAQILNDCHVLVLTSLVPESFGRVIIEAWAKGVVCIATNLGGPAEIIEDKVTGFLVPSYDSCAIVEKIRSVLADKELYKNIVYNARREVEGKYTLEQMSSRTLKVYKKAKALFNILVIKLSSLGDVVLSTASIATLKKCYPYANITVLCSRSYFKVIENLDSIDELVILEDAQNRAGQLWRLSNMLRKRSFDVVIDIQNNILSHLLIALIFPKKSVGFDRKLGFLLDARIDFTRAGNVSPLESQKLLLEPLGIYEIEAPKLTIDTNALSFIEEALSAEGVVPSSKIVGINISASYKWKTKNLRQDRIRDLIQYLIKAKKAKVVLTGQGYSFEVAEALKRTSHGNVINFCGRTDLKQLVALISCTKLFITPDSAPFHISQSLNVPTIGIFGPTNPQKHSILKENVFIVKRKIRCLYCYKKQCRDLDCMDISVENFSPIINEVI